MSDPPRVVGVAGSLRDGSYTRLGVGRALDGVRRAGGTPERIDLREYDLPTFDADADEVLCAAEFSPDELRDFVKEVGATFYANDRLGATEMNKLHYFQLLADYAEGNLTQKEVSDKQEEFESNHDLVTSGLESLRFRKRPDEEDKTEVTH